MARHSIDAAMLWAGSGDAPDAPRGRRLGVDAPYETATAMLVTVVAQANRCQAVWNKELGFSTVIGFPADLDAVELLHTSLLVQAMTALVKSGTRKHGDGKSKTRAFRSAFLTSYAQRIGERLTAAADDVVSRASAEPRACRPPSRPRGPRPRGRAGCDRDVRQDEEAPDRRPTRHGGVDVRPRCR